MPRIWFQAPRDLHERLDAGHFLWVFEKKTFRVEGLAIGLTCEKLYPGMNKRGRQYGEKEKMMAQLVTLNLGDSDFEQSSDLLKDIEQAGVEMLNTQQQVSPRSTGAMDKSDFRQHAQGVFDGVAFDGVSSGAPVIEQGHWLLGTVYGRDILKQILKRQQTQLVISKWRSQPELNDQLEQLIDVLGLRDLVEPKTLTQQFAYVSLMSRLFLSDANESETCAA